MSLSSIFFKKPGSSVFDLSHEKKLTTKMGVLTPVLCEEVLPGDRWQIDSEMLCRLMPTLSPVMHRTNIYLHYFFVPYRLIWDDYEKFFTGGKDGKDDTQVPFFSFNMCAGNSEQNSLNMRKVFNPGTLSDYLGVQAPLNLNGEYEVVCPSEASSDLGEALININILPFRAYQRIFYDYYRDQNLDNSFDDDFIISSEMRSSGQQVFSKLDNILSLRRRAWQHDYFTSSLPYTIKGDELFLPFALDNAEVSGSVMSEVDTAFVKRTYSSDELLGNIHIDDGFLKVGDVSDLFGEAKLTGSGGTFTGILSDVNGRSVTINDLRRSVALQRWLEKNARGGSRYVEVLLSHFGVRSDDARLDRVEYIGGSSQPVTVSEVVQTAPQLDDSTTPLGTLGGSGLSAGRSGVKSYYAKEHGLIFAIVSVMPRTAYSQGIRRHYLKSNRYDFYWNDLANIGEQAVFDREIYTNSSLSGIFGYMPRYEEYRFIPDSVHGDFRSSLEYWHLGRKFANKPSLNLDFITCTPSQRIFAVTDDKVDTCLIQIYNRIKALRKVVKNSNPI